MKNAKILIARYNKGTMTREQLDNYINVKYHPYYDRAIIDYILSNIN